MAVRDFIRARRLTLGWTLIDLADQLHKHGFPTSVDHSTISKLERGIRKVDADELPAFAAALMCEFPAFFQPLHGNALIDASCADGRKKRGSRPRVRSNATP